MSMNVSPVSSYGSVASVNSVNLNKMDNLNFKGSEKVDSFERQGAEKTTEEKQEILKKARKNASGWSIFGGFVSTAYYGLRSDKTIAKKYDLNPETDKQFINRIRKEQTLWSLTGGFGLGLAGFIVANVLDANKIDVENVF